MYVCMYEIFRGFWSAKQTQTQQQQQQQQQQQNSNILIQSQQ